MQRCARLTSAIAPVVVVAGVLPRLTEWSDPAPRFISLSSVMSGEGTAGLLDLDVIAAALGETQRARHAEPPARFPTPAGTRWRNVEIRFLDIQTVAVRVGAINGRYTYAQMGMADARTANPTKQWELLHILADTHDHIDWHSGHATRRLKKRVERLVADLRAFFGIEEGAPIEYRPAEKGWEVVVSVLA